MSDPSATQTPAAAEERRAELRVPASTLGDVRSRLIGGGDFSLLNYTSNGLYGKSPSRLLVGARVSVRLATATLDAIVSGRVVRSSLTEVRNGVPRYEVAVSLERPVDWSRDVPPIPATRQPEPTPVAAPESASEPDAAHDVLPGLS